MDSEVMQIRDHEVPVDGAVLNVAEYGDPNGPVVLAIHGLMASSRAWIALARLLPEVRLIAPDLRGRARSNQAEGPFGLAKHRDDMRAVFDVLDIRQAVVVGHSMGAFVAMLLAASEPRRVAEVVLVDGGVPIAPPPGVEVDELLALSPAALLGPAFDRLARVFPSREDYAEFWKAHPDLGTSWNDDIAAYADYDLEAVEGGFHPSANPDAVADDQRELFDSDFYDRMLTRVHQPTTALRAPLGLLAKQPGLYAPGVLDAFTAAVPQLEVIEVPNVNHHTIFMTSPGADVVADAVRSAVSRLVFRA